MLTYVHMGVLVVCMGFVYAWRTQFDQTKKDFISYDDTLFFRAFWCIIVIMVHIPPAYQNKLQDLIGSFAYIGVTFFYLASGYGLKYSVSNKKDYLQTIWKHRLPSLLIPAILANAFQVFVRLINKGGSSITLWQLIDINNWVKSLLVLYFIFWFIYWVALKSAWINKYKDIIIVTLVLIICLLEQFSTIHLAWGWIVEPLGFAYGILIANAHDRINALFHRKWLSRLFALIILSVIIGILYIKTKASLFWGSFFIKSILGLCLICLSFQFTSIVRCGNNITAYLGKYSYEIYLLHGVVFSLLQITGGDRINSGVYVILSVILTAVSAGILGKIASSLKKHLQLEVNNNKV